MTSIKSSELKTVKIEDSAFIGTLSQNTDKLKPKVRQRKSRRNKDEIEEDIRRYNELIKFDRQLENDIPPRRMKGNCVKGVKYTPFEMKQEEGDEAEEEEDDDQEEEEGQEYQKTDQEFNECPRQTRSRSRQQQSLQQAKRTNKQTKKPIKKPKLMKDFSSIYSNLAKPKFMYNKSPMTKSSYSGYSSKGRDISKPPILNKLDDTNSFDTKILLDHSYPELIKLIKDKMGDKKQHDNEGSIDFGMSWNLIAKNLGYEKERFSIEDPKCEENLSKIIRESETQRLNKTNNDETSYRKISGNDVCFSEDLDSFFRELSDVTSNFQTSSQSIPKTFSKDYLKKNISLA